MKDIFTNLKFAERRIKKKQDDGNDLEYIIEYFFQSNLTNEGSKERQEDPLLGRQGFTSHTKL